MDSADAS